MNAVPSDQASRRLLRQGALLAINLLFLMVWGFAGLDKAIHGKPDWFADKFGKTILATFPGLTASFWLLTLTELAAFVLALAALLRREFLADREPKFLGATIVWGLFVFVQLGFGQWLTSEYNATHQLFMYFCGTLVALHFVLRRDEADSSRS